MGPLVAAAVAFAPPARAASSDAAAGTVGDRDGASSSSVSSPGPSSARFEWRWQRFRAWEFPATIGALGVASTLRFAARRPSPDWTGGVLADDWVERQTAIQNVAKRRVVVTTTDFFFYGAMAYRLVDSAILPALVGQSPDVALQMSMIDLESFGFVAIALWGGQALFGRERPYVKRCGEAAFAAAEGGCSPDSAETNRSFFAGHPAVVLTAAGLTCTHHGHMPLYGGTGGDPLACGIMIGAAVATGVGRMVTEEHHLSDVVVGYAVGAFAGFLMPEWLHYRVAKTGEARHETSKGGVRATLVPSVSSGDVELQMRGSF